MTRQVALWAEKARAAGWTVRLLLSGHVQFRPPHGRLLVTAGTPSDWRAVKNFRADLRRAGLDIE